MLNKILIRWFRFNVTTKAHLYFQVFVLKNIICSKRYLSSGGRHLVKKQLGWLTKLKFLRERTFFVGVRVIVLGCGIFSSFSSFWPHIFLFRIKTRKNANNCKKHILASEAPISWLKYTTSMYNYESMKWLNDLHILWCTSTWQKNIYFIILSSKSLWGSVIFSFVV